MVDRLFFAYFVKIISNCCEKLKTILSQDATLSLFCSFFKDLSPLVPMVYKIPGLSLPIQTVNFTYRSTGAVQSRHFLISCNILLTLACKTIFASSFAFAVVFMKQPIKVKFYCGSN